MDIDRLGKILADDCRLNQTQPILAGVSGGPDSLCLMDSLAQLQYPLLVAHFDHRLRPESAADSDRVEMEAKRLGLPFLSGSEDVARYAAAQHLSLEEAARILRYRFLFLQARKHGAQAVAVGHTADDQVETVLMHLLRGTGLAGLRGMGYCTAPTQWDVDIPLVRPLLFAWREETVAYCVERGLSPVDDASNQDQTFFRNRLRHALIPYLESYNPKIRSTLWRMSQVLAGDEALINQAVNTDWQNCLAAQTGSRIELDHANLGALSLGSLRAVLRRAVFTLNPALRDVDYSAIERVVMFIASPHPGQVDLVKGLMAFMEGGSLVIQRRGTALPNPDWPQIDQGIEIPLEIPGALDLAQGWRFLACLLDAGDLPDFACPAARSPWEAWVDADRFPGPVCLRTMRPGDRFRPLGMNGNSLKLSDFWINEKLPRRARAAWPLIVSANQILWVPGFRLSDSVRLEKNTRKVFYLRLFREDLVD